MANIFENMPLYITVADLQDSTTKQGIKDLDDAGCKILIDKAQYEVDAYIGMPKYAPFDETQKMMFPVMDENGDEYLPLDIQKAMVYICEQIFENGDIITSTVGNVKKETTGPHSVEYSVDDISLKNVPVIARAILDKYKTIYFGSIV